MTDSRSAAIVGAFVLGGLGLAVGAILFFGGTRFFERTTRAVAFFEGSVAGLEVGAPVTFRGVRVGSVQRALLLLSPDGQARIPVFLELLPDQVIVQGENTGPRSLEQLVASGLRAQLNLQSFVTAQLRVDLDFRPETPARLVADTSGLPRIPTLPSDFERLRATLAEVPVQELAQSAQRAFVVLERLGSRLDGELGPLVGETRQTLEAAASTLTTAEQAILRLQTDASQMLREVDALAGDARRQLDHRGAELSQVLKSADLAARQAETLLASLSTITAPRSQLRGDLEAAVRDLAATANSLRGFAREIEQNPSAVLRGRGQ